MGAQLKKGVLDMCVISLILYEDRYGYDVYQEINRVMQISESTIYPILRRLITEKYATSYLKESNEGPARKYFKITNLGKNRYYELIEEWADFKNIVDEITRGSR